MGASWRSGHGMGGRKRRPPSPAQGGGVVVESHAPPLTSAPSCHTPGAATPSRPATQAQTAPSAASAAASGSAGSAGTLPASSTARAARPATRVGARARKRRQQRMTHPTAPAGGPPDPDPPGAAIAHPAQIAGPKAHRPLAAWAVGPGDLDPTAGCRIRVDTKQAGPYDGHGVPTPPWTLPERQLTGEGPLVSRPPDPVAPGARARIHPQSALPKAQP